MSSPTKILIAYDGTEGAEAALSDLAHAGLPEEAEAVVLSISEMWMAPPPSFGFVETDFANAMKIAADEALATAKKPLERLQATFPKWTFTSEGRYGSSANEILDKADQFHPDLIVVGSHGRSMVGRFFFGSVSHRIVTDSKCSVRVGRAKPHTPGEPVRIVLGIDGFAASEHALHAICRRNWPSGSEVRLVTSVGPLDLPGIPMNEKLEFARNVQHNARFELERAGLTVGSVVKHEDPKHMLVEEAELWKADAVFLGTRGLNRLNRILTGSVSTAVAARATCSVEIVR